MMKPQPKRNTAIIIQRASDNYVRIECTDEAFEDLQKYFSDVLISRGTSRSGTVSALYDFNEVIAYIEGWQPANLSAFEDVLGNDPR